MTRLLRALAAFRAALAANHAAWLVCPSVGDRVGFGEDAGR